ncbi:dihydropteroate synthase [Testudinibacter aquarius]|uniref:Dihydropteroate synthase n=1 Tax=Testudinibacter aquarius TaxID=1524974 RepID=A0A4R3YD54_9PAST|nr:dihydropteroate synthase [Testudinibacter aquarius]KAE9527442.1 dihydropteroate synthase [Testudinibacter aquarius]TCV89966.1 dihydropteroate synthase [Testudinibacter aquarius]TNG92997.1 dihydropteroate synthase [Testudinibacter aquarius]
MKISHQNRTLDLSLPKIMGILNFTPDSFSDSGQFYQLDKALYHVEQMLADGADIIDIGGESTRPMAAEVSLEQELQRVVPLVEAVRQRFDCWISVDTSKALVMREAAKVGMNLINDIRALQEHNALQTAVTLDLPVCIMHMQGQPRTMQAAPHYQNVVAEVTDFLRQRAQQCIAAGIKQTHLIVDPGFGFGKSLQHNYQLLQQLQVFSELGYPVLAGVSRKSMIGQLLDKPVEQRMVGSVAATLLAAINGASILRVHDVAAMADALKVWQAMQQA